MAGYSGTPLFLKLGITDATRVWLIGAPQGIEQLLAGRPATSIVSRRRRRDTNMAICFSTKAADLEARFARARQVIPPDGVIWAAWPKRASRVASDITEDRLRELFLPTGMVDVKVCAIDETWSGLKFVLRRDLRPT